MNTNKKTAIIVGVLFLSSTATFMLGSGLLGSILDAPDYLIDFSTNKSQVIIGVLLELICGALVIGIPFMMFPIFKKYNESLALGYLGFRIVELAGVTVMGIILLSLIKLSKEFVIAGTPDASHFQTLGTLAKEGYFLAFQMGMIICSLGGLIFSYLLYNSRLIPRSMSVLGLIGYVSLLISALLEIFGYSTGMILYMPGALFELILPIWLFVKGFNLSTITSESA